MAFTRRGVLSFKQTWDPTLLWYAKGVGKLRQRATAEKTSWNYLAAMHGISQRLWTDAGYLKKGEKFPSQSERDRYWQQCQHQSWYFLPWHRAYLLSFEAIVRDAIVSLGGPKDWALPYWNYSARNNPKALDIPAAFVAKTRPENESDVGKAHGKTVPNELYVALRFGTGVDPNDAELDDRIADNDFTGTDPGQRAGGATGVGGPQTPFSHAGQYEGLIEAAPHDLVHGDVGGRSSRGVFGLMSNPNTAALDPIFWIHHCNIDRLWEVWLRRDSRNANPTDSDWLDGPSDQPFAIFDAGGKDIPSTPRDMRDLTKLGYDYDDTSDPLGHAARRQLRLTGLGLAAPTPALAAPHMAPKVELMGASKGGLKLGARPITAEVKLAPKPVAALAQSFTANAVNPATPGEPDRVFLHLQNIRGKNDAAMFDVFVSPKAKKDAKPVRVGAFALFGLESASDKKGKSGGAGLTKVFEITKAIDAMHLRGQLDAGALNVQIVPRRTVRDADAIKVGQISLHRQSGT